MAKNPRFFSTLREFKKAVLITKGLVADKVARIRILSDEFVRISLDDQRFQEIEMKEGERKKLKQLLNT